MFKKSCYLLRRLLISVIFCLSRSSAEPPPTPVILISIDTLRADHLSAYGYRKLNTPHIDSLATGGTLYGQADSQIPLTLPSHTCLFTSTYPFENRIEENAERVPSSSVTLASVLHGQGYKTAAFVGSSLLDRRFGLNIGFDFYDSPFDAPEDLLRNPYSLRVRRDGALVFRSATQWLTAHRGQKVFVFIHLFDLHTPYSRPATNGLSGYDTEVAYVDQLIGRFQQYLAHDGWWNQSLVILFADHGESLGDHGEASHGYYAYQSTLWVPLLMHWPDARNAPARGNVDQPAGLIDVAPTILDFLHITVPPSFEGESLLQQGNRAVYSESVYARDAFRWAPLLALREGSLKYIDAPKPELYDLSADPHERINLISKNPGQAVPLKRRLDALQKRYATGHSLPSRDTSPETLARMRSLGYLSGGGHAASATNAPDPKDRLPEYQKFERGLDALYSGHIINAVATFQSILAADPHNLPARGNLGDALLKLHRDNEALRQWQLALHEDPSFAPADEAIGEYWLSQGDFARAKPSFEHMVQSEPADYQAQFDLGLVDRHLGLDREAAEHISAACRLVPESAACTARTAR